jgi:hypothetical protein
VDLLVWDVKTQCALSIVAIFSGLEHFLSFEIFLYWPSLRKCSTSDLLNFQKLSYNSSSVLGRSLTM